MAKAGSRDKIFVGTAPRCPDFTPEGWAAILTHTSDLP